MIKRADNGVRVVGKDADADTVSAFRTVDDVDSLDDAEIKQIGNELAEMFGIEIDDE